VVDSLPDLIKLREQLPVINGKSRGMPSLLNQLASNKLLASGTVVALLGVGFVGLSMLSKSKKQHETK